MSGFVVYLIIYYSKYYEGNFFVNYALQGFSDSISMFYISFLYKFFQEKTSLVNTLKFLVVAMICFSGVQIFVTESGLFSDKMRTIMMPILILVVKL